MINSKHINIIIAGVLLIAIIFTGIFTFFPDSLKIEAKDSQPEYESKLFNKDGVISIDIKADEDDWANMLENATQEEYISCDVTINGETFESVGIRPKGNSSLSTVANSDSDRYSFKFEFDQYVKGQTFYGLDKFVINNIQSDSTYMKDYLSYDLMTYMGVKTPLFAYTKVTVNGEDWGFYLAVEALEESFAQRNYGSDYGMLYKPESMGMRGNGKMEDFVKENAREDTQEAEGDSNTGGNAGGFQGGGQGGQGGGAGGGFGGGSSGGTDLKYTDDSISSYSNIFDYEVFKGTDSDYERVIEALKNLNDGTDIEKYIDVDASLRYFAVNTVLVNLDSYFSNMKHNYYLYEEDGKLTMLPWDYNLAFGGFQSGSASSAINFPIDTPVSGVELSERPFLAKLLEVDEYKEKYHEYLQEIVDNYFNSGVFESTIDNVNSLISDYVKNDPSAFCTYDQYTEAVAMIKKFGELRAESIQGQLDGSIPSTTEGQSEAQDKLIDASSINLSAMGSQGGAGGRGGIEQRNKNGNNTMDNQKSGTQEQENTTQDGNQPPDGMPQGDGQLQQGTRQNGDMPQAGGGNMQLPDNMPDREIMMQAMQIIQGASGSELTDDQVNQLKELGLTDDQITSIKNMAGQFGKGGMQGGGMQPGGMQQGERGQMPGGMNPGQQNAAEGSDWSGGNLLIAGISVGVMLTGILFVIKFKRRRYS